MSKKTYVDVVARFLENGGVVPQQVFWQDGRVFEIERVLDTRPARSLKAGGSGLRYTVLIKGRTTYLFLEENRWFVERIAPSNE